MNPPEPEDPVATFVEGVLAEAEAEAAPQAPEPQLEPALSTGVPVHPRDLDEQPGDLDVADDPVDEQIETTEPVQVVEAPPLTPDPDARLGRDEPHAEDIESFAGRRRRLIAKRQKARRSSRWTALVLVLFAFNVAVVSARQEVVRFVPQTASLFSAIGLPVNLRQLSFEDVRVSKEVENGVTVVAVDGKIVSKSARPVEVPRLRFAARNAQGREVYS